MCSERLDTLLRQLCIISSATEPYGMPNVAFGKAVSVLSSTAQGTCSSEKRQK